VVGRLVGRRWLVGRWSTSRRRGVTIFFTSIETMETIFFTSIEYRNAQVGYRGRASARVARPSTEGALAPEYRGCEAHDINLKDNFKHGHHFGGHLVFCANLISAISLERLYRSCSNLVHQFIKK